MARKRTTREQRIENLRTEINGAAETVSTESAKRLIELLDSVISEQKATIAEKEAAIAEKDATIAKKDAEIAEKAGIIEAFAKERFEHLKTDEYIHYLETALTAANKEAEEKKQQLKQKESVIAEKDATIASLQARQPQQTSKPQVQVQQQKPQQTSKPQPQQKPQGGGKFFRPAGDISGGSGVQQLISEGKKAAAIKQVEDPLDAAVEAFLSGTDS
ncbi:MAG: hypothetical protein MJ154_01930 [Candidatus Saccharibacteria bacterium]|nr:hypothetical protein [Candidatus Saccharibacteria bacterium]